MYAHNYTRIFRATLILQRFNGTTGLWLVSGLVLGLASGLTG